MLDLELSLLRWLGRRHPGPGRRGRGPLPWAFPGLRRRIDRTWRTAFERPLTAGERAACIGALAAYRAVALDRRQLALGPLAHRVGHGTVLAFCHVGPFEQIARLGSCDPKIHLAVFDRSPGCRTLHGWMKVACLRHAVPFLDAKGAMQDAVRRLQHGGWVAVGADLHGGLDGVWTPFFGRLASTPVHAGVLARRAQVPIVGIAMRASGSGLVVETSEPIDPKAHSPEQCALQLNAWFEGQIRREPEGWVWFHNRWCQPTPAILLGDSARGTLAPEGTLSAPFRIGVRGMNWLGDAILHLTALQAIKNARPDAHVTVITPAKIADLYRDCPFIDDLLELKPSESLWQSARRIAQARFDFIVVLPNSQRTALEAWTAGVPLRCGFLAQGRMRWQINLPLPEGLRARPDEHQSLTWLRAVAWLGGRRPVGPVVLAPGPEPASRTLGIVAPGAEYGPAKRWFPDRYAAAAQALAGRVDEWVLVGAPGDLESCERVAAKFPEATNLCGKTSLSELVRLLQRARLVLCNDSGVMHLAALCGAPTVAVFGSTEPKATRPANDGVAIVREPIPCSPCFKRECPLGHLDCLHRVTVQNVVRKAEELLDATPGKGDAVSSAWPGARS